MKRNGRGDFRMLKRLPSLPILPSAESKGQKLMLKRMWSERMWLVRIWIGCLMPFAGLAPLARADESTQPYVVLVGIDKYTDTQIKPRKHAEADAKALYDVFASKDYLGVDKAHIKLLLGSPDSERNSEPATRENILN